MPPLTPQNQFNKPPNPNLPNQNPSQLLPFQPATSQTIQKGSLCNFSYSFWKHDPSPLILICRIESDRIHGLSLHYLSLNYIKKLLQLYCGKIFFGYQNIKSDPFTKQCYRTYKKAGINNLRVLDCEILNNSLKPIRKLDPYQLQAIRNQIKSQLAQINQQSAKEMAKQYQQGLQTHKQFQPIDLGQDRRFTFRPSEE